MAAKRDTTLALTAVRDALAALDTASVRLAAVANTLLAMDARTGRRDPTKRAKRKAKP